VSNWRAKIAVFIGQTFTLEECKPFHKVVVYLVPTFFKFFHHLDDIKTIGYPVVLKFIAIYKTAYLR